MMLKKILLLLVFLFTCNFNLLISAEELKSSVGDILYVSVKEGVIVRHKPNSGAPKLGTIPYAERVQVIDTNGAYETIDQVNGRWIKIKWLTYVYSRVTGWVFEPFLSNDVNLHLGKDFSNIKEAPRLNIDNEEFIYVGEGDGQYILFQKINEENFFQYDFNVFLMDKKSKKIVFYNAIRGFTINRKAIIAKNNYRYVNGNLIYVTLTRDPTGSQREHDMFTDWRESLVITTKIPDGWDFKYGFADDFFEAPNGRVFYDSQECEVSPKNYFVAYIMSIFTEHDNPDRESIEEYPKYLIYSDTGARARVERNNHLGSKEISLTDDLNMNIRAGDKIRYNFWAERSERAINANCIDNYGYVFDKNNLLKTVYSVGFDRVFRKDNESDLVTYDMTRQKINVDRISINADRDCMAYEKQNGKQYELFIKNLANGEEKRIDQSSNSFGPLEWSQDKNTLLYLNNGVKTSCPLED